MFDSLRTHGLQHARLPCPSLSPRVCSASCPLSQWCHPTISSFVAPSPALSLSQHRGLFHVFSELALCIRWPKYWSFSFNITPANEHPGPISFRMDWLDLLAVQGALKSLLQHHSSKASVLQLMVQFSCACALSHFVSDSLQPYGPQPTRLPCPWNSPGKNTGVGCHFFLQ